MADEGSEWNTVPADLRVGDSGTATVSVLRGALRSSGVATLGAKAGAVGTVNVTGQSEESGSTGGRQRVAIHLSSLNGFLPHAGDSFTLIEATHGVTVL